MIRVIGYTKDYKNPPKQTHVADSMAITHFQKASSHTAFVIEAEGVKVWWEKTFVAELEGLFAWKAYPYVYAADGVTHLQRVTHKGPGLNDWLGIVVVDSPVVEKLPLALELEIKNEPPKIVEIGLVEYRLNLAKRLFTGLSSDLIANAMKDLSEGDKDLLVHLLAESDEARNG